jgi:hypothetical protein
MIRKSLVIAGMLAVLPFAPPTAGAQVSGPPLQAGTTWTYRETITPVSGSPQTGTVTQTFGGPAMYRGKSAYYIEEVTTNKPGFVERDYFIWTDGHLRQTAIDVHDAQGGMLEILFDKTLPFDVAETMNGQARVVQDGVEKGQIDWSVEVTKVGPVTVTVPAGTFKAIRWLSRFELGPTDELETSDSSESGYTDFRVDGKNYENGALTETTHRELLKGPSQ